jgi:hypothetical protein
MKSIWDISFVSVEISLRLHHVEKEGEGVVRYAGFKEGK